MRISTALALALLIPGCGEATGEASAPASLSITADTTWLLLGTTRQLTARIADSAGRTLHGPLVWASLDPLVAAVSAAGVVSPANRGRAYIAVTHAALADTLSFDVDGPSGPMIPGDFRCGAWLFGAPTESRLWLDAWVRDTTAPPALRAAGGRIVRAFHLPFVHVLLDRDSVPAFAATRPFAWFTTVLDTVDVHRPFLLFYNRPASSYDTMHLRELGATPRYLGSDWASASAPDGLVPMFRALPEVRLLDEVFPVCPAAP